MKDWKDTILKGEMRIVLFVSRNKDNKETIPNFKEQTVRFLTTLPIEEIEKQFDFFVNYGLPNEFSRCYISLNERDNKKTQRGLVHKLIDEDVNLTNLPSIAVSIAAKKILLENNGSLILTYKTKPSLLNLLQMWKKKVLNIKILNQLKS